MHEWVNSVMGGGREGLYEAMLILCSCIDGPM